jgi:hypothetical protein
MKLVILLVLTNLLGACATDYVATSPQLGARLSSESSATLVCHRKFEQKWDRWGLGLTLLECTVEEIPAGFYLDPETDPYN